MYCFYGLLKQPVKTKHLKLSKHSERSVDSQNTAKHQVACQTFSHNVLSSINTTYYYIQYRYTTKLNVLYFSDRCVPCIYICLLATRVDKIR